MVEYVLLVAFLVIGALVGIESVGESTDETFDETAVAFETDRMWWPRSHHPLSNGKLPSGVHEAGQGGYRFPGSHGSGVPMGMGGSLTRDFWNATMRSKIGGATQALLSTSFATRS